MGLRDYRKGKPAWAAQGSGGVTAGAARAASRAQGEFEVMRLT